MTATADGLGRCQAYVESGSRATARGGRRYQRCVNRAVATREITRVSTAWRVTHDIAMCGTHLKMHDEGRAPRLDGYERARGR